MNLSNTRHYVLYGAVVGVATYWWLRRARNRREQPEATDFDSFLRAPAPVSAPVPAACTSFESFLRTQPEQPNSTDFASFVRNSSAGAQPAGVQPQEASPAQEQIPEEAVPVLVMYGTEYGFAREIAEKLAQQLKETRKYW